MMPLMPDSTKARGSTLRTLRLRAGLSREALAAKLSPKPHHNTIQKLELGERTLSLEWIDRLAPALGLNRDEFLQMSEGDNRSAKLRNFSKEQETIPPTSNVYSPGQWPLDLPVKGIGECGPEGFSLWNGETIQMAGRPPYLAGSPKAYAVYAKGDSMEPRYFSGELLFINPAKPVEPGSFVLVQLVPLHDGDQPRAFVKRLVRRSASKVVFEQYNPQSRIEIKTSDIISMHLVEGTARA